MLLFTSSREDKEYQVSKRNRGTKSRQPSYQDKDLWKHSNGGFKCFARVTEQISNMQPWVLLTFICDLRKRQYSQCSKWPSLTLLHKVEKIET